MLTEQIDNPYLDEYERMLNHQMSHGSAMPSLCGDIRQPWEYCIECRDYGEHQHEKRRTWSWAIPNDKALDAIIRYSPTGLIEIGAGAGYWASLLRQRGLDVLAFDKTPGDDSWSLSEPFTEVLTGDHTVVIGSPNRTLLLCWPCYSEDWTHEVVELYSGDTIIYIGEGNGGCTGDDKMHSLLGLSDCWHDEGQETCDSCSTESLFEEIESVDIPQWAGLHDRLYVCRRKVDAT